MSAVVTGLCGLSGAIALVDAFMAAPDGADIEIRIGSPDDAPETRVVVVRVGTLTVGLTPPQARAVAEAVVSGIEAFPDSGDNSSLADLAMALRAGADEAERARS